MTAQRIGRYVADSTLGVGSFATVYRAVDETLDDEVAIKILAENHSLNPEIRERFISEGRTMRRVSSRHVATVHDVGETPDLQPYLVIEYADRGTLRDRVAALRGQGWKASHEELLDFARQLASGVGAIHRAGLVHRDLSPGNILLTSRHPGAGDDAGADTASPISSASPASALIRPGERLLLADLGLCKDLALNSGLTVAAGTSGFRPPEQERTGVVDARADVWAMSALLAWVAEGTTTPRAFRKVISTGTSTAPRNRQKDTETWLADVEQALAPPPPAPPADPTAAGDGAASRSADTPTAFIRSRTLTRVKRALIAGLAMVALVVGLVLGATFGPGATPPSHRGDSSIAISGPDQITVGEAAEFTADVEGVSSYAWTLPNKQFVADQQTVTITATSPGDAEVVLRSRAADGTDLEVRHQIEVHE